MNTALGQWNLAQNVTFYISMIRFNVFPSFINILLECGYKQYGSRAKM